MNARQARALLELMADLYVIAQTPEDPVPMPEPVFDTNGAAEPRPTKARA